MIYQRIYIDGVDITRAVVGWATMEPVYLAGSTPAVVEMSRLKVILPLLQRNYGISFEQLRDCEEVRTEIVLSPTVIERSWRVIN